MKKYIFISIILFSFTLQSQNLKDNRLWRSRGVYDSDGEFIKSVKTEKFLYFLNSNKIEQLIINDKVHMETGHVKIFVRRDTINLILLNETKYTIKEHDNWQVIKHHKDSITIENTKEKYAFSYVPFQNDISDKMNFKMLKNKILGNTIESKTDNIITTTNYFKNGLKKWKTSESDIHNETEYKLINFNNFFILNGIVSAPKIIANYNNNYIYYTELDYRFSKNKIGKLTIK